MRLGHHVMIGVIHMNTHPKFQIDTARNVFEGAISLNLQPKKMKALFKRYYLSEFRGIFLIPYT